MNTDKNEELTPEEQVAPAEIVKNEELTENQSLESAAESPLKPISEEILTAVEYEERCVAALYDKIAAEDDMTAEDRNAFSLEVWNRVQELEESSANFLKAYTSTSRAADELATRQKDVEKGGKKRVIIAPAPANSVVDAEEKKTKSFAQGINFYKLALLCIIGSFVGVVIELIWCMVSNGYIESRSGLVFGPFNILYGIGAVALTMALYKFRNCNVWISFFSGMLVGSIVEYVCSWAQELVMGSRSWDYSNMPFNINGRICLLYSAFWGILGVLWIKDLYPRFASLIVKIPNMIGKIITWVLVVFMVANCVVSLGAVVRWSERVHKVDSESSVIGVTLAEFFDDAFPNDKMSEIYANMVFDTKEEWG
ncbi:MAG: putative ABC transporter permease [Firmicutes bacterium]|nr:putative ABC transporter permease [Bacillota bacterium]